MPEGMTRRLRAVVTLSLGLGIVAAWLLPGMSADPGRRALRALVALLASYLGAWAVVLVWSRPPRNAVIRRFSLVSLGLVAGVALLEGLAVLDAVDFASLFDVPPPEALRPWNRPDPELIHLHRPGARLQGRRRGGDLSFYQGAPPWRTYSWDVTMDSRGFRNPPDRTQAHYAILGDSFVEGLQVSASETVGAVVESATGRTVLSFGQSGYGPYQERVVLDRFILPARPRVVIWLFYEGNDLIDLAMYREALRNWPALMDAARPFPRRRLFSRNLLLAIGNRLYAPAEWPRTRDTACVFQQAGGGDVTFYFLFGLGPLGERQLNDLAEFGGILRAAHETLSAHAIRLVLAFVPAKFRVYQPYCRIPPDSPLVHWRVNDLPRRMEVLAAQISGDLVFTDLTAALRTGASRGELVYLPDDTHWSERGHRLAGESLAQALAAAGL